MGSAPAEGQMGRQACREESALHPSEIGATAHQLCIEGIGHTARLGRGQPRAPWARNAATRIRGLCLSTMLRTQYTLRKCGHAGSIVTTQIDEI